MEIVQTEGISPVVAGTNEGSSGRDRVLDAAASLFVDRGYGATLREIADGAGIKAGSIYHHFDSKQDLFLAVLDRGIAVMHAAYDRAQVGATAHPAGLPDLLTTHVRAHLGALFEHGPYTTAHVTAFFTAPETVRDRAVKMRDGYEQRWNGLLDGVLAHPFGPDLRLIRLLLFGAMNSSVEWFDPAGPTSLDQLACLIANQFLNGVGVDPRHPGQLSGAAK